MWLLMWPCRRLRETKVIFKKKKRRKITKDVRMYPNSLHTFRHIQEWDSATEERRALCAQVYARISPGLRPAAKLQSVDLPASDGRVRVVATDKPLLRGPGMRVFLLLAVLMSLCPAPCYGGIVLRVLYLHDNAFPKNQLWRNGRRSAEVIGCRLG